MISQLNSSVGRAAYLNTNNEVKENTKKTQMMNQNADLSRVDQLRNSIASGEYKIDLSALSKRIADELM